MADHSGQGDQHTTPDDVATLYSWANLHGAKYRDFSASRAQVRESARLRVQEATEAERQRVSEPVQLAMTAEAERAAGAQRLAEWEAQQSAQNTAQMAAQLAAHQAAQEAAQQAAVEAAARAAQNRAAMEAAQLAARAAEQRAAEEAAQRAAETAQHRAAQEAAQLAYRAAEQRAAEEAAKRAAEEAEHRAAQQAARLATEAAEQRAAQFSAELAALKAAQEAAQKAAQQAADEVARHTAQQPAWQPQPAERIASIPAASAAAPYEPPAPQPPFQRFDFPGYDRPPQGYVPPVQAFLGMHDQPSASPSQTPVPSRQDAARDEPVAQPRYPWPPADSRENAARPAWLMPGALETSGQTPQPPTPAPHQTPPQAPDTLQGSRDRLASRWFALRGVFEGGHAPVEAAPAPAASRAPVMAVFSLAGGVGKTSLVATLGRALSARGERVLLVDTAAFGLLPFFFGARDQRPGLLRTFSPPGVSNDAPIQMVTIDPESLGPEPAGGDAGGLNGLSGEISRHARAGVSRVIVDLATASGAVTRKLIRMAPMILVPVVPDMNSVVSVTSIDDFFEHNSPAGSKVPLYYVMNQFDPSLPLHLDIREVLRQQLGDRLLPFALRRTPAVSEALAEGMTVMDYAPNSTVAEDFATLAGWVKSLSAPATTTYRGVRWSER
jgi:cellulose synthase operon protein YhjQ